MRICCESCITWFDIEPPASLRGARRRLKFRCGRCGAVVLVDNPLAAPDADGVERTENLPLASLSTPHLPFHAPLPPPPEEDVMPTQEVPADLPIADGGLMLKQEGKTYRVKDLATIQRWILERRVLREDLLSREGSRWEPAQSHPDLELFFTTIERLEQLETAPPGALATGAPMPPLPEHVPMGNALVDRPPTLGAELADAFALDGELPSDATEEFFDPGPVMLYVPPASTESPFSRDFGGPSPAADREAPGAQGWPALDVAPEPERTDEHDLPSEPSVTAGEAPESFFDQDPVYAPHPREPAEPRGPALLIILVSCLVLAGMLLLNAVDRDTPSKRRIPERSKVEAPATPPEAPTPAPAPPPAPPPEPPPPEQKVESQAQPDVKPELGPTPPSVAPKPKPKPNADALANQGWDAIANRELAEADRLFRAALSARSDNALAHYGQGYTAQLRGDTAGASRAYCAALRYGASDADLTREVSALLRNSGGSCD